jgi:hypothetical protein
MQLTVIINNLGQTGSWETFLKLNNIGYKRSIKQPVQSHTTVFYKSTVTPNSTLVSADLNKILLSLHWK